MREWENATWKTGMSEAEVIRRVGRSVARRAVELTAPGDLIIVLAGTGNNGADARSALEQLEDRRIDMLQVRNPEEDLPELETLLGIPPALVIDGLFGIGINRPLNAAWIRFIERINASQLPVLAIDVPSGLDADTGEPHGAAVEAVVTLTVGSPKVGLVRPAAYRYTGRLEITPDVGLVSCPATSDLQWIHESDFRNFPPRRKPSMHKGSFGHVGIIAGSTGFHGAAVLAARGAQRARPGLVTLITSAPVYPIAAAHLQAVMVGPWSENISFEKFDALLAGPGLAGADIPAGLQSTVELLWRSADVPMVVDASALAWLPKGRITSAAPRVITPHPGEAARLLESTVSEVQVDRANAVRKLSATFANCHVALKGFQTVVGSSSGNLFLNPSGGPNLGQGGSGDVLAGFLAGLLAQPALQADVSKTIQFAVWRHGATADALDESRPNWVVEELVAALTGNFLPITKSI